MQQIKLTRWATYLVPGSVFGFALWMIIGDLFGCDIYKWWSMLETPAWMSGFALGVTSYVLGIGLWGLSYFRVVQGTLFGNPHNRRVSHAKYFLKEKWRQEKYFAEMKRYFPSISEDKRDTDKFEYSDFQFVITCVYEKAGEALRERISSEREHNWVITILDNVLRVFRGGSRTVCDKEVWRE